MGILKNDFHYVCLFKSVPFFLFVFFFVVFLMVSVWNKYHVNANSFAKSETGIVQVISLSSLDWVLGYTGCL